MKKLLFLIPLLVLASAHAATYATVDWHKLPAYNVYDPFTNRNELITRYSYGELNEMLETPGFRRWNDVDDVCESMRIMFGRSGMVCGQSGVMLQFPRQATARAYVSFELLPRPVLPDPYTVILVDPVYPPWSPTYNPYW